ncbi:MAG: DNA polymerase IV [Lachnospiraceae bacterium]|nr:DNA polymerase IV [Lachnospiraceae bacterium]
MSDRVIFHVDVNSAFLSWSALKALEEDPDSVDLRTIPSAVGGDVRTRHGIITAKSIPAKKYGIETGEPVVKALQKCPGLVLVSSDFTTYKKCSAAFMEALYRYSDTVEQASIDEAYVDMTGREGDFAEEIEAGNSFPLCAAEKLKNEIRDSLGFTVNVGISSNKLLAKMASDFTKPDRIHTLFPEEVPAKMWVLPIEKLFGCGGKTSARLREVGIKTIGDAAAVDPVYLQKLLGDRSGEYIYAAANGWGSTTVCSEADAAKSYSNERTTSVDVTPLNYDELGRALLKDLSKKVSDRMKKDGARGKTVSVSIKTSGFRRHSRQTVLSEATDDPEMIYQTADRLLTDLLFQQAGLFDQGDGIRLIGVGVTGLEDSPFHQMDVFQWMKEDEIRKEEAIKEEKKRNLQDMLDKANGRYGNGTIRKGM